LVNKRSDTKPRNVLAGTLHGGPRGFWILDFGFWIEEKNALVHFGSWIEEARSLGCTLGFWRPEADDQGHSSVQSKIQNPKSKMN
jgi:hypothetical protein